MHILFHLLTLFSLLSATFGAVITPRVDPSLVQAFEHKNYQGKSILFVQERELNKYPTAGTATCYEIPFGFGITSITISRRSDGKVWQCALYAFEHCKGDRNKGEMIFVWGNEPRYTDFNDKTRSLKCWMGRS